MKLSTSVTPRRRIVALGAVSILAAGAMAACGPDDGDGPASSGGGSLTMWTLESEPNRVARTERNLAVFTEQTGIAVDLVTIEEANVGQAMLTNAASGTLPDVIDHPMVMTARWASQGLLDAAAAAEVIERLGADTFSASALDLASYDGSYVAVPTSGWGMLLHYREDWFAEAGIESPRTLADIAAAAEALHDPGNGRYGIVLGSDPGHQVTQQIFEYFALANGCELIDDSGELLIDSDRCVEVLEFYGDLLQDYAPTGTLGSVDQRAVYLAGQAAMMPQGPFTLHRIAGLEDAEMAVCDECADDPGFLAENTGVVSVLEGFHGDTAQWGRTSQLAISVDADTEGAMQLVEYLLSDGYVEWLAQVPNGMIPVRAGTAENPTEYIDAWQTLDMGVDREGTLLEYYGEDVIAQLVDGADEFDAWGVAQGYGELAGVLYELYSVPQAVIAVRDGDLTPEEAAATIRAAMEEELSLLDD